MRRPERLERPSRTVSRRLAGFERKTGVKLFERGKDGLTPTQLGAALTDGLDLMAEGALAVERRIASRDTGLQGPITVTSLDWLGDYILAPIAARLAASILSSRSNCSTTRVFNISRRDADITFRFGTFEQEDLVPEEGRRRRLRPLRHARLSRTAGSAEL